MAKQQEEPKKEEVKTVVKELDFSNLVEAGKLVKEMTKDYSHEERKELADKATKLLKEFIKENKTENE